MPEADETGAAPDARHSAPAVAKKPKLSTAAKAPAAAKAKVEAPPIPEAVVPPSAAQQQYEAEEDFLNDFPPAPANTTVLRKGDAIKFGEAIVSLDVRKVGIGWRLPIWTHAHAKLTLACLCPRCRCGARVR
jgi:hypothetical protein